MLSQVLQLEVPLVDSFSCGIVAGQGKPDHELLLESQILEISIEY